MIRFVALQGSEYVRRRVTNDELNFGPDRQPLCRQILTVLMDNRLVSGRDPGTGDGYYELTHEALIQAWSTYRQWIQQIGPAQLAQREELAEAASRYERLGKRRAYVWGSLPLLNLLRAGKSTDGNPARGWQTWGWNFRSFRHQFGRMAWLNVPELTFLRRSFLVQRQNKLAVMGVFLLLFMALGVGFFFQSRDAYVRQISNARYAESQNAYHNAAQQYEAAHALVERNFLLTAGRRFLRFDPDSLPLKVALSEQRAVVYQALSRQLERADTLTSQTVLLMAGRSRVTEGGIGVAQACKQFKLFIQTDALYRTLYTRLHQPNTQRLLDANTIGRLRKRAQDGYQVTDVMLANLLTTCREVQEGFALNNQPDLVAQYGRYINELTAYQQRVSTHKPDNHVAVATAGQ